MSSHGPAQTFNVELEDLSPAARIREIALRLFSEHGPSATSIRLVASAAGVSTGAVLHHYKSKDALERAVLESVLARMSVAITGVGLDSPTLEALRERRAATEGFLQANPAIAAYLRHVYFDGGPPAARVFHAMGVMQREQMQQLIAAGMARPLPDPEIGLLLYHAITSATMLLRPLLEGISDLDLDDPAVHRRFREAEIDLLTRPLFIVPGSGDPNG
jgi:AcrR family transcriptional regulator